MLVTRPSDDMCQSAKLLEPKRENTMRLALMALVVCTYSATAAESQWKQRLQFGQQLEHAGRFEEAGKIFEQKLHDAVREEPRSVRVGAILANMADLAGMQGRYRPWRNLSDRAPRPL
jgi:hypothetical protein